MKALLFMLLAAVAVHAPAAATAEDHFNRGLAQYERGNYEASVDSFEQAIALDEAQSPYHLWLGRAYGRVAEQSGWFRGYSLAHRTRLAFERAVELDKTNRDAVKDLMAFYEEAPAIVGGDPEKAESLREILTAVSDRGYSAGGPGDEDT